MRKASATEGVECRKDKDVIDETPAAYEDIDAVMSAHADLVDFVHTLKQVVCVKGCLAGRRGGPARRKSRQLRV